MYDTNLDVGLYTCGSVDFSNVKDTQQMDRLA